MTNKKKIALTVIGLGLVGIGLYLYNQTKKLMNFCISFKGAKVNQITPTNVDIGVTLGFENKSDLDVTVTSYTFDVLINNVKVTKLSSSSVTKLAPKKVSNLPLRIQFSPLSLKDKSIEILKGLASSYKANVKVTFKGSISAQSGVLKANNYPMEITYTLKELMTPRTSTECK